MFFFYYYFFKGGNEDDSGDTHTHTSELLAAGGAVAVVAVTSGDPVARLALVVVLGHAGREHGLLALAPSLPLVRGEGLGEAKHEECREEE